MASTANQYELSDIVCVLEKYIGKNWVPKCNEEARIVHDLKLAGDDIYDFLEELHITFGTTFYDDNWDRYFPDEASAGILYLASLFGYKYGGYTPVTLRHLVNVCNRGAWFPPPNGRLA